MAYEQTSLYGLILQTKRRVNYESIDREISREIFIRDALVAGEVDLKADFFKHNRALIAEVEHWEDKTRRRDLLVDEQALFDFYDSRIPDDVASLKSFEDWRHRVEKDEPRVLFLEQQDVLARETDDRALHDYPDTLHLAGHDLALSYVFEPGSDEDGVTVHVPLGLLDDISEQRMAWLVPGLIAGKIEALLRGLPKPLRRQLVPLPDTVEHILDGIRFAEGDLLQVLSQAVSRRGVRVAQQDWQEAALEDHFRMNICVLGGKKEKLAQGRDLQQLRKSLTRQGRSVSAIDVDTKKQWERVGIKSWDFPDLPECITTQSGGLPGKAYPALHKTPQGLALTLFQGQKQAQAAHGEGVAELVCYALAQDLKAVRKQLRDNKTLLLHANAWITIDQLDADLSYALVAQYLAGQKTLVYTQQEFDRVVVNLRPQVVTLAQQSLSLVAQTYQLAHQVLMQLKPLSTPIYAMASMDMQQQLLGLKLSTFLREVEYVRWQHYPRYLKAMLQRLDKLTSNVLKDDKGSAEMQQRWAAWQQLVERWQSQGKDMQPLLDYRWLLEEYRVSIFAQPMKTAVPVSNVRLDKVWAQLTG
jgi:ATP-dependent helicase HrpA